MLRIVFYAATYWKWRSQPRNHHQQNEQGRYRNELPAPDEQVYMLSRALVVIH
jgi:hypothetical protein